MKINSPKWHVKILLLGIGLFLMASLNGQKRYNDPLFPLQDINLERYGWLAEVGINRSFALNKEEIRYTRIDNDTLFENTFQREGLWGGSLSGGGFLFLDHPLIHFVDGGLRFSMIRGVENHQRISKSPDNFNQTLINNSARFSFYHLSFRLNANTTIRTSQYGYILTALGLGIGYAFTTRTQGEIYYDNSTRLSNEGVNLALNYKLGYGFRLDKKHFINITLETPILNIYPWDDFKSTFMIYNSRYRVVSFHITLLFLNQKSRPGCDPTKPAEQNSKRNKAKLF